MTTLTQWTVLYARWVDTDPDSDAITVSLQANGKRYAVACSGPKGMRSDEFISALRVGTASIIRAAGGCGTVEDAKFDTGDQRAN